MPDGEEDIDTGLRKLPGAEKGLVPRCRKAAGGERPAGESSQGDQRKEDVKWQDRS